MPFLSKKQNAWGHTAAGIKALGGPMKVKEWESSTDYHSLPERKDHPMAHRWLQGAIKKPGKLTSEAHDSGRSKAQQAEVDSHSSSPSKRGRGLLGLRLIKGKI